MFNSKFQKVYRQLLLEELDFLSMMDEQPKKQQAVFVDFLNDQSWDDQEKVQKLQSQLKKLQKAAAQKKVQPKKAKQELKVLYNAVKKVKPQIAQKIKDNVKNDLQVIKKSQTKSVQKKDGKTIQKKQTEHEISGFNANEIAYSMIDTQYKKRYIEILQQYKNSSDKEVKIILSSIYKILKKNSPKSFEIDRLQDYLTELLTIDIGKEIISKLKKLTDKIADEQDNDSEDSNDII